MTRLQERLCEFFFLHFLSVREKRNTLQYTLDERMERLFFLSPCAPLIKYWIFFFLLNHFLFSCNIKSIFCIVLYNFVRLWYFLLADFVVCFTCMMIYFCQCIHYFPVKMLEPSWQKQYCGHWLVIITVVIMIISSCSSSSSAPTDEWLFSVSFILYLKARFRQTNERSNLN